MIPERTKPTPSFKRRAAGTASKRSGDAWAEQASPYTENQYTTLITALSAEVQAAEGGQA